MKDKLLSRDEFRERVFKRDNYTCLVCEAPAVDAHHIIERRLFDDGGYYLDNGASVCSEHHLQAEMTTLDADALRCAAGITSVVLPDGWDPRLEYSKWGDILLEDGTRIRGPIFWQESVQKVLKMGNVLDRYMDKVMTMDVALLGLIQRAQALDLISYHDTNGIEIRTSVGSSVMLYFFDDGEFDMAEMSIDGTEFYKEDMNELIDYLDSRISDMEGYAPDG